MDKKYLETLHRKIKLAQCPKPIKILRSPRKMFQSILFQLIARIQNKDLKVLADVFWDETMITVIPEIVSLGIFRYGYIEEGLTRMIIEHLEPGMVFFDIGAHIGYFSLLASKLVGEKGKVHSFEPTPSSFSILKANVLNKKNIFVNNLAIGSKRKYVFINDYGTKYSAFNSIYDARLAERIPKHQKIKKHKIESISIDNYVNKTGVVPNFIKIDAESSEYEILRGLEETIEKFCPMISVEVGDLGVKEVPKSKDIISLLVNMDYQPYEFMNNAILPHSMDKDRYCYNNILFLPKK